MINDKLKQLRKENGDTLKDLAKKINYDFSNLSKIERGIRQPSLPFLKKIGNLYNVGLDYFLDIHYSPDEKEFMSQLELASKDIREYYHLYLDGKELLERELVLAIEVIRKLREAEMKED